MYVHDNVHVCVRCVVSTLTHDAVQQPVEAMVDVVLYTSQACMQVLH
jgi:hypothetical protein